MAKQSFSHRKKAAKTAGNLVGKGGGGRGLMCVYGVYVCLCLCVSVREQKGFGENLKRER